MDLQRLIQRRLVELPDAIDGPGGFSGGLFRIARDIERYDMLTDWKDEDSHGNALDAALDGCLGENWRERRRLDKDDDPYDRIVLPHFSDGWEAAKAHPWVLPTLADLLTEPDVEPVYLAEGLWPHGGKIMFSAPQKAGKTTAAGNILRALADGVPVFGDHDGQGGFPIVPLAPDERIFLADFEMTRGMLRRWLREQGIHNTTRIVPELLRGRTWDIRDPDVRASWARYLRIQKVRVIVVDPLASAVGPLGIDESSNVGMSGFLHALDALVLEAGASELLVAHHTGHNGERSRGAAVLRGWPDVEWHLTVQGQDGGRDPGPGAQVFFSAYGRDVEVPETALAFDRPTRRLSLSTGNRATHVVDRHSATVAELVAATPGLGKNELEARAQTAGGLSQKVARDVIQALTHSGQVHTHAGPNRRRLHYPGASCGECQSSAAA